MVAKKGIKVRSRAIGTVGKLNIVERANFRWKLWKNEKERKRGNKN